MGRSCTVKISSRFGRINGDYAEIPSHLATGSTIPSYIFLKGGGAAAAAASRGSTLALGSSRRGGALAAAAGGQRSGGEWQRATSEFSSRPVFIFAPDARLVRRTKTTVAQPPVAGTRRPLVEVGNVINGRPAQADPSREKGVASVAADKCVKANKQQKENNRVKPQVIVISSDSENEKKNPAKRAASRRAPVNTLTKILNKCSRASDGVICSPKKAPVTYNIDASDTHNELAVVDYVEEIYRFYKSTEGTCRPLCTYMSSQTDINERMRAILVDWLIEVHYKLMLMPETLYLTVYIIDQYLSMENVPRKELQLVGVSAMLIASKYEEIRAPLVKDLLCISYNSFTREQVLSKEKSILNKLQWNLTVPTMYMFIVRYLKAAMGNRELENMAFFYAELSLVQYTMLLYAPSVTAAAAVYAARCTLNMSPLWSDVLEHHTGLAEWQLLECARRLASLHATASGSKHKGVHTKYSNPKLGAVSLYSPAKRLI